LIWQGPFMTVGGDTYIHDMLSRLGLQNVYSDQTRYPQITIDDLRAKRPDYILLSSEPFPFKEDQVAEISDMVKDSQVILVDGEYFSWYGSRLLHMSEYASDLRQNIIVT